MKSGTDIIPEELFDPTRIGDVMQFLIDFPIPGRDKVDLLISWGHAVGTKLSSSRIAVVYNSGTDTVAVPGG